MNVTVALTSGSKIIYTGEDYHYLNWSDIEDCFVIVMQRKDGGKKEIAKFPRVNVLYLHSNDEPECFDALKGLVG